LNAALNLLYHGPVVLTGAGRTDSGVHARHQAAHYDSDGRFPLDRLVPALNANLPGSIRVLNARVVPDDFSARFSAVRREYRYFIRTGPVSSPFFTRFAWHHPRPLALAPMQEAAAHWLGTHDFAALCADDPAEMKTQRTILATDVTAHGPFCCFTVAAPAFLRSQVRRMVGLLAGVGRGDWPPVTARDVLTGAAARPAKLTAPANGLFLWAITYPGISDDLPGGLIFPG
ncbi:MAG TPA: tRNA pseudouridine synthase A, partial [bacterium]|nr:tRNA pseudouridine synthase A [bacterium]